MFSIKNNDRKMITLLIIKIKTFIDVKCTGISMVHVLSLTEDCGVDPGFHIVGGDVAEEGAYPWMVWTLNNLFN